MKHMLKKIFLQNTQIKIISLILGYSFWYIFSQSHTAHITLDIPICFYNAPQKTQVICKDKVKITLSAKRADLYTIDRETLALHIDLQDCKTGNLVMRLDEAQLLLPDSIHMTQCYPPHIAIDIRNSNT